MASTTKSTYTSTTQTGSEEKPALIRATYNIPEAEKKLLQRVYDRYCAMRDNPKRVRALKVWEKGRRQWEAMREERGADEWQSNHYVPVTTAVIEAAVSEIIDQSPKPFILARGSEDIPKTTVMKHIFDYTWEVSDSDLELEDIIHDAITCGTGIGQEYYFRDTKKVKDKAKKDSKYEFEESDAVDFDDCYLECVKLEDFFVDENARSFRGPYGARDCIRRYIINIDSFNQFFQGPMWDPFDNAKYVHAGGDTNYYEFYKPPQGIDQSKQVEVLWYWSARPDDWLIIVANDVVVVAGPNPYKHKQLPFARAVDIRRTHEFYGKGEAELLESIQDETNTLRRMIIDRNHLDIDKMFIGSSRINLSDEDMIARPHGFIPADDKDSLKAVEYGDIPRSVELSLKHLEDDATISTGINPRSQALPSAGTATEAAIIKESTLKRIRLKVRRLERELLTRIARIRVSNILQFYSQPKLEEVVGEKGTETYKNEIAKLQENGDYQKIDGKDYKKSYREIRLQDKMLDFGTKGDVTEKAIQGFSFFKLKPEYFLPSKSGYDIKIAAGSTLPISEPLQQSKTTEMYDRLIQLAVGGIGYDPVKLGDELLRVNHFNPDDYKIEKPQESDKDQRVRMLLELANTENKLLMQGKKVPGTPYASAAHTAVHVGFTSSEAFQKLSTNDPRVQNFIDHIVAELAAQNERGGATSSQPPEQSGTPTQAPFTQDGELPARNGQTPTASNGANRTLTDILPSKIQGGGQVPPGI